MNDDFLQQFLQGQIPHLPSAPQFGTGGFGGFGGMGPIAPAPTPPMAQPSMGAGGAIPRFNPSSSPQQNNGGLGGMFGGMSPFQAAQMLQHLTSQPDPAPPPGTQVQVTPQVNPATVAPAGTGWLGRQIQSLLGNFGLIQ